MILSALRRNLLVGSLGLALSAGLISNAVAGEQLQQIKDSEQHRVDNLAAALQQVGISEMSA